MAEMKVKNMLTIDKAKVLARFQNYAEIDTASDGASTTIPSTACQFNLAEYLQKELLAIGLSNVKLDEHGYVYAKLPSNSKESLPVVGLVAHMDTSPEASGKNVIVKHHENYLGDTLYLSKGVYLDPTDFPEILNYIGQDILTSDGTTLLGADDKAGICIIISACEYLVLHPEIEHGEISICFTPDEEIGRGANHFNLKEFGANFA